MEHCGILPSLGGDRQGDDILGYFDPLAIVLNFRSRGLPAGYGDFDGPPAVDSLLDQVPGHLMAHEVCHFLQAMGTTSGLMLFHLSVHKLQVMLHLLSVAPANSVFREHALLEQVLRSPQTPHSVTITLWDRLREVSAVLGDVSGGMSMGAVVTSEAHPMLPPPFALATELLVEGVKLTRDTTIVRVAQAASRKPVHVTMGYLHLAEGSARAIEFAELGIEPHIERYLHHDVLPPELDPYWSAYLAYLHVLQKNNLQKYRYGICLEFVALCDLAMMFDDFGLHMIKDELPDWLHEYLHHTMTNSMGRFIDFVGKIEALAVNRLGVAATDSEIANFQEAILKASCGPDASLQELTQVAHLMLAEMLGRQQRDFTISQHALLPVFEDLAPRVLNARARGGGAPLMTDLLVSRQQSRVILRNLVPAYGVGGFHIGDSSTTFGDLSELRFINDAASVMIEGDRACPWHVGQMRVCKEPVQALCTSAKKVAEANNCARRRTLLQTEEYIGAVNPDEVAALDLE